MLYKADISYIYKDFSKLESDPAVKIHGMLMHNISKEHAERLHRSQYHPFSLYCVPTEPGAFLLRVSVLDDTARELIDTLYAIKKIPIFGADSPAIQTDITESAPLTFDAISESISDRNELYLSFLTPATYRSDGKYHCFPNIEKYFYSVISKINAFENADIEYGEFSKALDRCQFNEYHLESRPHQITGYTYYGMCGSIKIKLPEEKNQSKLLRSVFSYAVYCGTGAKTTHGMGGFTVT